MNRTLVGGGGGEDGFFQIVMKSHTSNHTKMTSRSLYEGKTGVLSCIKSFFLGFGVTVGGFRGGIRLGDWDGQRKGEGVERWGRLESI